MQQPETPSLIYRFGESVKRIFFFSVFFLVMGWYQAPAQLPELGLTPAWMHEHDFWLALAEVPIAAVIVTLFLHQYVHQLREYNPKRFGRHRLSWQRVAVFLGGTILLLALVYSGSEPPLNGYRSTLHQQLQLIPWTTIVGQILCAPLIEELLYRGIFMNYFWNRENALYQIMTVLSAALIFGLLHDFSWSLALVFWTGIGFIHAGVYEYTRDLRYTVVMHLIVNIVVLWYLF
ncbi:MAG: CPBP family intramembrane metalloprotease [Schleiferilactobacillus harbinensis]|jgi:membrane protease YdiL (CAAX protease family)|uniref:CAAX prenyl protease 2/Lysostaphin resistance protein A-like domain-containing protein n=1 Tax=Schleiferilactobacillus perolens DSM 12744 TaxID=1423792 RepID=A0A0R1N226_9LACO|nr:type II CAAX endopeptidase family protein [Schleiferilactobacillus perolens]KRL12388.1 hypothetical protein FD09_GL002970 [Schleiferilactobacillus perolens DSM 12744]MCI1892190.1 CPBP family intramembrane metalloprotease [Schleiferilactobacillus harbinensis]MCI1913806.1 CPBP family intramembrane metalloprotease [Schleiferilactobacillus harbinensis]